MSKKKAFKTKSDEINLNKKKNDLQNILFVYTMYLNNKANETNRI